MQVSYMLINLIFLNKLIKIRRLKYSSSKPIQLHYPCLAQHSKLLWFKESPWFISLPELLSSRNQTYLLKFSKYPPPIAIMKTSIREVKIPFLSHIMISTYLWRWEISLRRLEFCWENFIAFCLRMLISKSFPASNE